MDGGTGQRGWLHVESGAERSEAAARIKGHGDFQGK